MAGAGLCSRLSEGVVEPVQGGLRGVHGALSCGDVAWGACSCEAVLWRSGHWEPSGPWLTAAARDRPERVGARQANDR